MEWRGFLISIKVASRAPRACGYVSNALAEVYSRGFLGIRSSNKALVKGVYKSVIIDWIFDLCSLKELARTW